MGKLITLLFLFLALPLSSSNRRACGEVISEETLERKLKVLNKPAVKSIQSEDGDIIDCVDIHKQPAFDHPALKNHKIQMRPSSSFLKENLSTKNNSWKPIVSQTWRKSGSCPEETVPIRRVRKQDLLRATSLENFGRKLPQFFSAQNTTDYEVISGLSPTAFDNRAASILFTQGSSYIGAKANINVWNPFVEPEDMSTAQMWIKAGPRPDYFESMEVGWAVNQKLYGDRNTRLFIYWTKDGYKRTGCFDLTCSGFVQTSPDVALGQIMTPVSIFQGQQYDVSFGIYKDPSTGNWWLHYEDTSVIGYWPVRRLMNYMNRGATLVEWGGEVYSPNVKKKPHTKTDMGSGDYASYLKGKACYVSNVRVIDSTLLLKYPDSASTWADEYNCYTTYNYAVPKTDPVFYFGGPGQLQSVCP